MIPSEVRAHALVKRYRDTLSKTRLVTQPNKEFLGRTTKVLVSRLADQTSRFFGHSTK